MRLPMRAAVAVLSLGLGMSLAATGVLSADRLKVEFSKTPTGAESGLAYEYSFTVTRQKSGEPVEGADFTIATDMPSMPGAHHMPHVKAEPAGKPGSYRARIDFDMTGGWNLILRFKKPHRDQVVITDEVARRSGGPEHAGHKGHKMPK